MTGNRRVRDKAPGYSSLTRATIKPPWAMSAPNSHFRRSAFTASMLALVSCRKASMSALTAAISALVAEVGVEEGDVLLGEGFCLLLGEAAFGQALDEAMGVEGDGFDHALIVATPPARDKENRASDRGRRFCEKTIAATWRQGHEPARSRLVLAPESLYVGFMDHHKPFKQVPSGGRIGW